MCFNGGMTTTLQLKAVEDLQPGDRYRFSGKSDRTVTLVLSRPYRHDSQLWLLVKESGQDPRVAVFVPDRVVDVEVPK